MNIVSAILALHPEAKFRGDYIVITDPETNADSIYFWNEKTLGVRDNDKLAALMAQPDPVLPRSVQGAVLIHALDKATKVTPRDLAYVAGLTAAREDMASIARIASVDGLTAKAWFDAALGVTV